MPDGDVFDVISRELEEREVIATAAARYSQTDSYQSALKSKYAKMHHYYAPLNGDQWPEDSVLRPGKIHITANLFRPLTDVDARLQAKLPRISLGADSADEDTLKAAEQAERLYLMWLELSGWDVWMRVWAKCRSMYGKGVLKPIYNKADKRPDVVVVENPANLRIGWGSSDYNVMDWALYEYSLSPLAAMQQFPNIVVTNPNRGKDKPLQVARAATHDDPLLQKLPVAGSDGTVNKLLARPAPYQPSAYEDKQVSVWDYWYKKPDGSVWNAIIIGRQALAVGPVEHPEYPEVPYIVTENDHSLGNPEGIATGEDIIDIQIEYNRALSHFAQLVADEVDPAYQLNGENADSVPAGMVPKGGEIVAPGGGNTIMPIQKGVNQFPIQALVASLLEDFHLRTGFSEIVFGKVPSADVSGRALAVQVEAVINRLEERRSRGYEGLRQLLLFWGYMIRKINPQMDITDADGKPQQAAVKDVLGDFKRWRIIAPEITPRDVLDSTTNLLNQVNGKVISLRTAMDLMGVDSPERELDLISQERGNASLFPGDVNAKVAVVAALIQIQQQAQALGLDVSQLLGGASGQLQAAGQQAAPQGFQGDNGASPPMPATAAGGPPPPGGQGPAAPGQGVQGQTLVRAQPDGGAQTLQQLRLQY